MKLRLFACLSMQFLLVLGLAFSAPDKKKPAIVDIRPVVATAQYDNARTGANLFETILTPQNVNANQFGRIASLRIDGDVYAQPLYVPHVEIPGKGTHNVVFIVTEYDTVFAFDADIAST